jgi:hypothetical protein
MILKRLSYETIEGLQKEAWYTGNKIVTAAQSQLELDQQAHNEAISELFEAIKAFHYVEPNEHSMTQFEPYYLITKSKLEALKAKYLEGIR